MMKAISNFLIRPLKITKNENGDFLIYSIDGYIALFLFKIGIKPKTIILPFDNKISIVVYGYGKKILANRHFQFELPI